MFFTPYLDHKVAKVIAPLVLSAVVVVMVAALVVGLVQTDFKTHKTETRARAHERMNTHR